MSLSKLAVRGLLRNRFRNIATMIAVSVAVLTFVLLRTVITSWTTAADYAPKDRLVTHHKVTFVMPLPLRYVELVRQSDGIRLATYASYFGGQDPKHDRETFVSWAVAENYLEIFDEFSVSAQQKQEFLADKTGAMVGDVLANKLGWKVGERITLESGIFPSAPDSPWTFTVRAIYTASSSSVDRSTFLLHWSYLNDALPQARQNQVGWIATRTTDPKRSGQIAAALDQKFASDEVQTQTQDEKSFQASVLAASSTVLRAIATISLIILLIMSLVLGNTIGMSVAERLREFGVLRALGFESRYLVTLIIAESSLMALVGGLLGLALSYPLIERGIGVAIEQNMGTLLPHFKISPQIAAMALIGVIVIGGLVAILPAYQATSLRVSEALRKVS